MSAYLVSAFLVQAAATSVELVIRPEPLDAQVNHCCAPYHGDGPDPVKTRPAEATAGDAQASGHFGPLLLEKPDAFSSKSQPPLTATTSVASAAISATRLPEDSAQPEAGRYRHSDESYDAGVFWRQAKSIPWRFGSATAAITATGFANWDWGSSSFHFDSEGWFGKDTASLGMDKLGHAYSAYVLTEFFTDGIEHGSPHHRSYTAAILAMGLMTYIEVFDGFSAQHGFSHEDLLADAGGVAFSVARRAVPGLREKLDFRLLYIPSRSTWRALGCLPKPHCDRDGATVRSPLTDYVGQRYLLALKLSGFEPLKRTPLRLLELHGGYYARGFTREEEERGDPLRRRLFFGVGLNVGELLFPGRPRGVGRAAKSALEYLQLPYTAVHSN